MEDIEVSDSNSQCHSSHMDENICTFSPLTNLSVRALIKPNTPILIPLYPETMRYMYQTQNDYYHVANLDSQFFCDGNILFGCANLEDLHASEGTGKKQSCSSEAFFNQTYWLELMQGNNPGPIRTGRFYGLASEIAIAEGYRKSTSRRLEESEGPSQ